MPLVQAPTSLYPPTAAIQQSLNEDQTDSLAENQTHLCPQPCASRSRSLPESFARLPDNASLYDPSSTQAASPDLVYEQWTKLAASFW